jgi:N-acetylglucosamine kinase-like BadF-type ATPase
VGQHPFSIGVDGGGSKTECILVDAAGEIVARHLAPGCNPSIAGAMQARLIVTDALHALASSLHAQPSAANPPLATPDSPLPTPSIRATLLCMAGNRGFWQEFASDLAGFGRVTAADDSLPVLELATQGRPGLVLHSGTGSFVAARAPDGALHYAGGLGWRFGDPGSAYDIGRRTIARGLLELQGWAPASRLGPAVREHAKLGATTEAGAVSRYFYQHPDANRIIAALAPRILELAGSGETTAREIVGSSTAGLIELAERVAARLFPGTAPGDLPAGVSGPILTHPTVLEALRSHSHLTLNPVEGTPIEGVRRLLARP